MDNNNLTINWREEIINLFPKTTQRTKGEHDEWCPKCHGLGLVKHQGGISGCSACSGKGIMKACQCGKKLESMYRERCDDCWSKERQEKMCQQDRARFEAATKVSYKDYDGLFLWDDIAINKDELGDILYWRLRDREEVPIFIWGTKKEKVFSEIDLYEIVSLKCEDGYEDMNSYFDFKDKDFTDAQLLIDKWLVKHDSVTDVYFEDYRTAVLLGSLIDDIRQLIEREDNR